MKYLIVIIILISAVWLVADSFGKLSQELNIEFRVEWQKNTLGGVQEEAIPLQPEPDMIVF